MSGSFLAGLAAGVGVISAPGPQGPLAGTMIDAGADAPVVLIIPGSGPTDRDGNNPMGVAAAPYRLLAEALGERSVSTVRIDKRGMFGSEGAVSDPNAVTIVDYAADAHSWIGAIRDRAGADCVWLLGHSEGGLVALVAAQQPESICGVVLVATAGRRISDVMREQLRSNPANAPVLDVALAAIDSLEAGERVDTADMHPALQALFAPQVQGFIMDFMSHDPAKLASRVRLRMMIVQGGRDIQVSQADFEALRTAGPGAEFLVVEDMSHVLKTVDGEGRAANLATYTDPSLPVSQQLANAIAEFVKRRPETGAD